MKLKYSPAAYFSLFQHPLFGASGPVLLRILKKYRREIEPAFLPKLLSSLLLTFFMATARWIEYLVVKPKLKKVKVLDPIIILGHPRSGTTYLHYLLAQDPNLSYCNTVQAFTPHTFVLFGKFTAGVMKFFLPKKRAMDNLGMGAKKPSMDEFALANLGLTSWCLGFYFPKTLRKCFEEQVLLQSRQHRLEFKKNFLLLVKKLQIADPGKPVILKSPANTARVKELLELFPNARFVHIYRNPYRVYLSTERLYEKILPLFGLQKVNNRDIEDCIVDSYQAYHKKWFAERDLIPSKNLYEFAFEDFVKDPMPMLEKMYEQFGLAMNEKTKKLITGEVKAHDEYEMNRYQQIKPEIRQQINEKWQECFRSWHYKIEG